MYVFLNLHYFNLFYKKYSKLYSGIAIIFNRLSEFSCKGRPCNCQWQLSGSRCCHSQAHFHTRSQVGLFASRVRRPEPSSLGRATWMDTLLFYKKRENNPLVRVAFSSQTDWILQKASGSVSHRGRIAKGWTIFCLHNLFFFFAKVSLSG